MECKKIMDARSIMLFCQSSLFRLTQNVPYQQMQGKKSQNVVGVEKCIETKAQK